MSAVLFRTKVEDRPRLFGEPNERFHSMYRAQAPWQAAALRCLQCAAASSNSLTKSACFPPPRCQLCRFQAITFERLSELKWTVNSGESSPWGCSWESLTCSPHAQPNRLIRGKYTFMRARRYILVYGSREQVTSSATVRKIYPSSFPYLTQHGSL